MNLCGMVTKKTLFVLSVVGACVACATTQEQGPEKPVKTHYTLSTEETVIHPSPLPRETPVDVEWFYSNGDSKKQRGYTGWDFDGDGRFEMVEVHAENTSVQATVFDFDGDGEIDKTIDQIKVKEN